MKKVILFATLFLSFSVSIPNADAKSKAKSSTAAEAQRPAEVPSEPAGAQGGTVASDSQNLWTDQRAEKELSAPVLTVSEDETQGVELSQSEIKDMKAVDVSDSAAKATTEGTTDALAVKPVNDSVESETPVFKKAEKQAATEPESATTKLLMTLGILCVVFGAAYVTLKRFSKREQKSADPLRIKVLGHHFLSPKRSLLVVQIAGETLLLGATDQNINLLKNLSLLDEDIPTQTPAMFDTSLKNHAMDEDLEENFALQGLTEVRDRVTKKLSEMRNL